MRPQISDIAVCSVGMPQIYQIEKRDKERWAAEGIFWGFWVKKNINLPLTCKEVNIYYKRKKQSFKTVPKHSSDIIIINNIA